MASSPSSNLIAWWWMLDYVLHHQRTVSEPVANALLLSTPHPDPLHPSSLPLRIHRHLVLRHLSSSLPLSSTTLRSLSLLHSLSPSPSLPAAHAAVAAHLAAAAPDFAGAVSALFGARVAALERCPAAAGLLSGPLMAAGEEMAAAVADPELRARIVERRDEIHREALQAIRVLVAEQREAMGPPILEVAAELVRGDDDPLGRDWSQLCNGIVKILDSVRTPELDKVIRALKSRYADLHKVVVDPLPYAAMVADEGLDRRLEEEKNLKGDEVTDELVGEMWRVDVDSKVHDVGKGIEVLCLESPSSHTNAVAPPSLMDWDPTARTYEAWQRLLESYCEQLPPYFLGENRG